MPNSCRQATAAAIAFASLSIACMPEDADRFYVRTNGADMYVQVDGNIASDTFVLVLHGGPGGSSAEYNLGLASRTIEEQVAMVYWDQRGQGASRGAYSAEGFDVDTIIEDTETMVDVIYDRYGPQSEVFLYGHSWGGLLGTAALLRTDLQNNVAGWINSDGPHDIPLLNVYLIDMINEIALEEIAAERNTSFWTEAISTVNAMKVDDLDVYDSSTLNALAYEAEGYIQDVVISDEYTLNEIWHYFATPSVPALAKLFAGRWTSVLLINEIENMSLTGLDRIELPTLLLWGSYDFVVPPQLGYDQLEAIGADNAQLVEFAQSGHSPMTNQPEVYASTVLDFVTSQ